MGKHKSKAVFPHVLNGRGFFYLLHGSEYRCTVKLGEKIKGDGDYTVSPPI